MYVTVTLRFVPICIIGNDVLIHEVFGVKSNPEMKTNTAVTFERQSEIKDSVYLQALNASVVGKNNKKNLYTLMDNSSHKSFITERILK